MTTWGTPWKISDMNERQRALLPATRSNKHGQSDSIQSRSTLPASNMEQTARLSSVAKKENPRLDPRRRIILRITSYRHRLADPDGISAKALIDGLVHCGVCADDSSAQIAEVRTPQVKISKDQQEHTVVEIMEEGRHEEA